MLQSSYKILSWGRSLLLLSLAEFPSRILEIFFNAYLFFSRSLTQKEMRRETPLPPCVICCLWRWASLLPERREGEDFTLFKPASSRGERGGERRVCGNSSGGFFSEADRGKTEQLTLFWTLRFFRLYPSVVQHEKSLRAPLVLY